MTLLLGPDPNMAHCTECAQVFDKPELPMNLDLFVRWLRETEKAHTPCPNVSNPTTPTKPRRKKR